jgi:hypothetical protein
MHTCSSKKEGHSHTARQTAQGLGCCTVTPTPRLTQAAQALSASAPTQIHTVPNSRKTRSESATSTRTARRKVPPHATNSAGEQPRPQCLAFTRTARKMPPSHDTARPASQIRDHQIAPSREELAACRLHAKSSAGSGFVTSTPGSERSTCHIGVHTYDSAGTCHFRKHAI